MIRVRREVKIKNTIKGRIKKKGLKGQIRKKFFSVLPLKRYHNHTIDFINIKTPEDTAQQTEVRSRDTFS
jgi:hypothetical protein